MHQAPQETGFFKNLSAYAHQIKCRSPLYDMALGRAAPVDDAPLVIPPDPWPGDAGRGYDIVQGLYLFDGQSFRSVDVLWEAEDARDGWLTAMHGFDMLRDLRAFGGERARQHARYLISDWLDHYSRWHALAWRPDITARRIVHWLSSYSAFCASAGEEFRHAMLESLSRQIKHLSKHAGEGDLLYTAKALFYGGMAMGQEKYCRQALHILAADIQNDILSDGGHKSRAPEKHLVFLQNLLDIRAAIHLAGLSVPDFLTHTTGKMAAVLRSLRHNDGGLALFHGGGAAGGSLCDMVLAQAGASGGRALKSLGATGYDRLSQGRTTVIMDTGNPPERQHYAGLLAFEMSAGRDRLIVNCGAWAGHPAWQQALASTAAHSTVTVEESNALPENGVGGIPLKTIAVTKIREDLNGTGLIDASHDGYLMRFGVTHRRILTLKNNGNLLHGQDILSGMDGTSFAARFHLHPSVRASVIGEGSRILLRSGTGQGWEFSSHGGVFELEESVYSAGRHTDTPRKTLQIAIHAQISVQKTILDWTLSRI